MAMVVAFLRFYVVMLAILVMSRRYGVPPSLTLKDLWINGEFISGFGRCLQFVAFR